MSTESLDFVALQVRDLDRSAKFYLDVVGLTRNPAGPPHAVVFDTKPIPFAVRTPDLDLDAVDRLGWGVALWLRTDDSDVLHKTLVDNDVEIVAEPTDGQFGRQFAFRDPDGYTITVHDKA
jgi:predicted enzyme related to lactoylglutathione lyase